MPLNLLFPLPSGRNFTLTAADSTNQSVRLDINSNSGILYPSESIKFLLAPTSIGLSLNSASGLLQTNSEDDPISGLFYHYIHNSTLSNLQINTINKHLPSYHENTEYEVFWLDSIGDVIIDCNKYSGVYTLPHNIQLSEIYLSGVISSSSETIDYTLFYTSLKNEGHTTYVSGRYPYLVYARHKYNDNNTLIFSGSYPSGVMSSGISFSLPYYDNRITTSNVPAYYNVYLNYNAINTSVKTKPIEIPINHAALINNFDLDLESTIRNKPDINQLTKVGEVDITTGTINRKRLAIGIEDIYLKSTIYEKYGEYISEEYNLSYAISSLSLYVDEFIPEYSNIIKYDMIKYYISFNNDNWIRISPNNRLDEYSDNILIPKIISPTEYTNRVNTFKLKIEFFMSNINDNITVVPEVRTCKFIIAEVSE